MTEQWLAQLDLKRRKEAETMIKNLWQLGVRNADDIVRKDFLESVPSVAAHLFLHDLQGEIEGWCKDSDEWVPSFIESCEIDPERQFADAGVALERMVGAGINPADIGRVARMVAYKSLFHFLHVLDQGSEAEAYQDLPGWKLVEVDPQFRETGRTIKDLHDQLREIEPREVPEPQK
jgi:hypothetical protein